MPREFTSGFDVLGMSADPTPGDPEAIARFAERHAAVRDDARRALDVLGTGGEISSGRGEAMDALRRALKSLPDKLRRTVDSFDQATRAYEAYAADLTRQQAEIDDAMRSATAVAATASAAVPELGEEPTPEERSEASAREEEILTAQASLGRARSLAEQIKRARDLSAQTAADELELAAAKAIPERGFFEKVGDFFQTFPFIRLLVDLVIAIITIVAPVLGPALAGLALAAFTAASFANGSFKLGTFVVDLLALVPGGSLLRGAGRVASSIPVSIAGRSSGDIVSSIKSSRDAISSIPLQNAGLVAVRETAANAGRTTLETTLNGDPVNGGTIVLGALSAGAFLGGLQLRGDQARQKIRKENAALPPDQRKELPFDAEHDLDSIQEDARERLARSVATSTEFGLDRASAVTLPDEPTITEQLAQDEALPPFVAGQFDRSPEDLDRSAATNINNNTDQGFFPNSVETLAGLGVGAAVAKFGFDPIATRLLKTRLPGGTPPPVPGTAATNKPLPPLPSKVGDTAPQLPPLRPQSPFSVPFRK